MKPLIQGLKIITLGILLGLGIGIIQAASWSSPTVQVGVYSPSNTNPPLNVGTDSQVKPIDATDPVDGFGNHSRRGGLSVNTFSVAAGAQFLKSLSIGNSGTGDLTVNENQKVANNLIVTTLATSNTNQKVCTDTTGKLILCP